MKKGTSLVELIAVIVILGIIASITTIVAINVIHRQKKNATITSLNDTYRSAQDLLCLVETTSYDEIITVVDNDFCYVSLTTMIETGRIRGNSYIPQGPEVYFCYDMNEAFVVITDGTVTKEKPESTGTTLINGLNVSFNYESNSFVLV